MTVKTQYHVQVDIADALRARQFDIWQRDDGTPLTPAEAKEMLEDELAAGHKFICASSECDTFSPMTGCPGHRVAE